MSNQTNIERLTEGGVIPKGYDKLTDAETATINAMSADEIKAVISAASKMDPGFIKKHAQHGLVY